MKSNADQQPELIYSIGNGKYHFCYNLEINIVDDKETYKYEVVEIDQQCYDSIIQAIINDKYPASKEIAMINNFNINKDIDEYIEYQRYRRIAKYIASCNHLTTKAEIDLIE